MTGAITRAFTPAAREECRPLQEGAPAAWRSIPAAIGLRLVFLLSLPQTRVSWLAIKDVLDDGLRATVVSKRGAL